MKSCNSNQNKINLETTCRICLSNTAIKNIYSKKKSKISVPCNVMITTLFSLSICYTDGLPSKLCRKCYTKLVSAYKLKLLAEETFTKLLEYVSNNYIHPCISSEKTENEDNVSLDKKHDVKEEEDISIKREVEDVMLVGCTVIKEECVTNVLNDVESDYDIEDDKPLLFYGVEEEDQTKQKSEPLRKEKRRRCKFSQFGGPSVCDFCGKVVKNIKAHLEIHKSLTDRKQYPCSECPKIFRTSGARRKHCKINHLGNKYYCKMCDKTYKRGSDHIRSKHSNRPKVHECMLCDKRFAEKGQLNYHMTSHTKEKPYSCDICGKTFRTNNCCLFHKRRVHDKEKNYICNVCSKAFFAKHHLSIHMRSHTKEKIYKCTECDKKFATSSALSIHKKRHFGVKTHLCQICSRSFVCPGSLKTHMISHTRERTHPCRYCGVMFGRTDHRNRHEKTAHKEKLAVV